MVISKPNAEGKSTTIVITTHYIEEARQANSVGMMRYRFWNLEVAKPHFSITLIWN